MGWASAGDIFDPVAEALIEAGASDELKRKVLSRLIGLLRDGDWDTEGESLEQFKDDPVIVAAFADHGVKLCGCCSRWSDYEPPVGDPEGPCVDCEHPKADHDDGD